MNRTVLAAVVVTSACMMISAAEVGYAGTPASGGATTSRAPTPDKSAPSASSPAPSSRSTSPDKPPTIDANKETAVPDDAANARNAARTRMRECGHQWSGMKKSGAANGLTWKEFSQGCLARK